MYIKVFMLPYRYLFYVTLSYSFSVLRPIEQNIKKSGGKVAWFIPNKSEAEKFLLDTDTRLYNIHDVKEFNANANLTPGNMIPDFFPGIKVQVFHGFDSGKKNKFNIRGFFDLYCTQGPNITKAFNNISDNTCEITETGWSKLDPLFLPHGDTEKYTTDKPLILYAPTFSSKLTSMHILYSNIKKIVTEQDWHWIVKLHPKATKNEIEMYKSLSCDNLTFIETDNIIPILQAADVILSDTSSILTEFALQEKIAISFNNRRPEKWMLNFKNKDDLLNILQQALMHNRKQLDEVIAYGNQIHPYKDGKSSERVLSAVNKLILSGTAHLKKKPLNFIRRIKIRKKLRYYHWR